MEEGAKQRDLEGRTYLFGESVRTFVKQLSRRINNAEDVRQLVRASGSFRKLFQRLVAK
jgi:hypothetical protein